MMDPAAFARELNRAIESAATGTTRDLEHYHESGDCVILVEDKLFKVQKAFMTEVHRFLLMQDGSTFGDMFILPQPISASNRPQGSSDDEPITLIGDSPAEFRALCWILYALPPEIQRINTNTTMTDISSLSRMAMLCHKYSFSSLERWALEIIFHHFSKKGLKYAASCTYHELETLLILAVRTDHHLLRSEIESQWITRLIFGNLFLNHLKCELFKHAVDVGEKHGLRRFLGKVYYLLVTTMPCHPSTAKDLHCTAMRAPLALGAPHDLRLLVGFHSLSMLWERLATANFTEGAACTKYADYLPGCLSIRGPHRNDLFVHTELERFRTVDVLGKIKFLQMSGTICCSICVQCKEQFAVALSAHYDDVKANLADHFLGPEAEAN